jgi:ABC-type transporter Mla MlaB component
MLKISKRRDGTTTILDLEGKLAGPWVDELEHCWAQAAADNEQVRVLLKTVTFIDAAGRRLLTDMQRRGVDLVAYGCMTKAIVEEISRRKEP